MCKTSKTILNLDIMVPSQTRYLRLIGNIAEQLARDLGGEKSDRETLAYHLNLVVTEAVTNAIQYGCANERKDKIRILLSIENSDLCVRVYDYGQGFDFEAVPVPEIDELSERGRGIFFIRSLMDHVTYRKTESGNVLEMKKRIT
jgi:serine/threonine-protein kinase RsbW